MDEQILITYCLSADLLIALQHPEDPQCRVSDAEVLTIALTGALYFGGNFERARVLLHQPRYVPRMLSRSRFNRRLHRLTPVFLTLFGELAQVWKHLNTEMVYVLDSFPIAACDNYRIPRNRLYGQEAYRGKLASKHRYFYGVKVHLMITVTGHPVEFLLSPGSVGDVSLLSAFAFDLPAGSRVVADRAYTYHLIEDLLAEHGIAFQPIRKRNSLRPFAHATRYLQAVYRQRIETTGSALERLLPHSIHAVTAQGFELKVLLFVLAVSLQGCFT